MNPEIKTQWLEALRSGDYKQGTGVLRRTNIHGDTYCCLGVLCDLYDPERWSEPEIDASRRLYSDKHNGSSYYGPPSDVEEWAEFGSFDPSNLADMNDYGDTFQEIANFIERNL